MAKVHFLGTKIEVTSYISYGDIYNIFEGITAAYFRD